MKKPSFKKSILVFVGMILFSHLLLGAEGPIIGEKEFNLPDSKGTVAVKIREARSHFGLPYTVELKATCSDATKAIKSNSLSNAVCDVKPGSLKLSSDRKSVLLKVRETDSDEFNERSRTASPEELMKLEPKCKLEATEVALSIAEFC